MPPTTDETEAAAGRLREIAAATTPGDIWHHYPNEDIFAMRHVAQMLIADAWLALHPADDGDAITAAWMDAVGGDDERGDGVRVWRVGSAAKLCAGRGTAPGLWHCWVREGGFDEDSVTLPLLTTRGQLRRLLAALGVPVTERGAS